MSYRSAVWLHPAGEDPMPSDHGVDHDTIRRTVMAAVRDLDGLTVRDVLLQSLLTCGVDDTVSEVVIPVLHEVGQGWERGDLGVLHEHFVSSSVRGVLGDLRVPVQGDRARIVVLACPPHELHDLPLELFGAMLHARSWQVVSLGANTPMSAVGEAVRFLEADACVLAGVRRSAFESRLSSLARLGDRVPLFLAGEGALALPNPPARVTVLPRDLRVAAAVVDAVGASAALGAHDRNEPAVG
jgi:MerR family transcriptional regulator, light-induced transcriptional regulator